MNERPWRLSLTTNVVRRRQLSTPERLLIDEPFLWSLGDFRVPLERTAVERIRAVGKPVYCVWSGARLKEDYNVDHCFPYAAWPCGDAWNLMPAARRINIQKSNRLVTQAGLARASERIVDWWTDAWLGQGEAHERQFFLEATQTLPVLASSPGTADVIDAMKLHRIRLAKDQGLRPWEPASLGERVTAV